MFLYCSWLCSGSRQVDTLNEFGSPCDTIGYLTVTYTQHISLNIDLKRGVCLPTLETHGCQKRALCTNTRRVKDIEIGLQLWMTLVGPMYQTSDCLGSLCISMVDLSLNIDMVRRLGAPVL